MKDLSKASVDDSYEHGINDEFKINSLKLVRLVRGYEILYNSNIEGYSSKHRKDATWEYIYEALFPQFHTLDDYTKNEIRVNVRRRWKALRDSIAREVKKNATVQNYTRKKESTLKSELEFLIPHIKSLHCVKLTDALRLRECYATTVVETEMQEDSDSTYCIDLTEDCDVKPDVKVEAFQYSSDDETDNASESKEQILQNAGFNNSATTEEAAVDNAIVVRQFCTVTEYKGGEIITLSEEEEKSSPQKESRKRPHCENDGSKEIQSNIYQMLSNLGKRDRTEQHDGEDEDRMFLLSLVSDLRRIPAAIKMNVKKEIVTAIARANH